MYLNTNYFLNKMHKLNPLEKLSINKTLVFFSPIEEDDSLVRTGIIKEKLSFIHALLYGYSRDYISMDNKNRIEYTRRLTASIFGQINKLTWQEIGCGLIAKEPFINNFKIITKDFYNLTEDKPNNCNEVFKELLNTISFKLRSISKTSSLTPGIVENSWLTPAILTATIADQFKNAITGGSFKLTNTVVPAGATAATAVTVNASSTGTATLNAVLGAILGTYTFTVEAVSANAASLATSTINYSVTTTGIAGC
jgi:hypothetical protein